MYWLKKYLLKVNIILISEFYGTKTSDYHNCRDRKTCLKFLFRHHTPSVILFCLLRQYILLSYLFYNSSVERGDVKSTRYLVADNNRVH